MFTFILIKLFLFYLYDDDAQYFLAFLVLGPLKGVINVQCVRVRASTVERSCLLF